MCARHAQVLGRGWTADERYHHCRPSIQGCYRGRTACETHTCTRMHSTALRGSGLFTRKLISTACGYWIAEETAAMTTREGRPYDNNNKRCLLFLSLPLLSFTLSPSPSLSFLIVSALSRCACTAGGSFDLSLRLCI